MARIGTDIQHRSSPTEHFKALEHTKVYDLLAALPLIVWYGLCASARLSGLVNEISVTNYGVIDLRAIVGVISNLTTLVFFGTLIALLIFRNKPQAKSEGLFPRAAAIAGNVSRRGNRPNAASRAFKSALLYVYAAGCRRHRLRPL